MGDKEIMMKRRDADCEAIYDRMLNILAGFWTVQGLTGTLVFEGDELRTQVIRKNISRHKATAAESKAMKRIRKEGLITVTSFAQRDDGVTKGALVISDQGIQTMIKRAHPQNALYVLVDRMRNNISHEVRDQDKLYEELDRIEKDLRLDLSHNTPMDTYHRLAASLHKLLMDKSARSHVRNVPSGTQVTLADLYFGDGRVYGEYDGLPEVPGAAMFEFIRETIPDEKERKKFLEPLRDLSFDPQGYVAVCFHTPKAFNPLTDPLLTRHEWLSQRLAYGDTSSSNPEEKFHTIFGLLDTIRNTMASHTIPTRSDRRKMERFQRMVTVNDGENVVTQIIISIAVYMASLMGIARITRQE